MIPGHRSVAGFGEVHQIGLLRVMSSSYNSRHVSVEVFAPPAAENRTHL